jgi:hypothetical protein
MGLGAFPGCLEEAAMTPTQQWILCLALVYAVPSFLSGVGITLLLVRRRDIRHALATMPDYFFPKLAPASLAPTDESTLPGLKLR